MEDGALTGVMGYAPLSSAGLDAVWSETFDGARPDLSHIAGGVQRPAAGYGWGMAGRTPAARRAVVAGAVALYERILPEVPWFTRAVTPDGRRVILGKFGYVGAPGCGSGLLVRWPKLREQAA
jgi:hypothetical protein